MGYIRKQEVKEKEKRSLNLVRWTCKGDRQAYDFAKKELSLLDYCNQHTVHPEFISSAPTSSMNFLTNISLGSWKVGQI